MAFLGPGSLVQDIDPDDEGDLRLSSRAEAERLADETGRPVRWRGGKVQPDYRPGHTRV